MEINQIHANLITTGHIHNPSSISKIILNLVFTRHKPSVGFARHLFFECNYNDPFIWNAIIRSCSHGNDPENAFQVFVLMLVRGVLADAYSFSLVLKSCSRLQLLSKGIQIHGLMLKLGFGSDLFLQNCLLCICAKNEKMGLAQNLFDKMPQRDVVSWACMVDGYARVGNVDVARYFFDAMPRKDVISCNAMMAGYVSNGRYDEALNVFDEMLASAFDLSPDRVTLLTAFSAVTQLGCIIKGIEIHSYIEKKGFVISGKLGVALINMYAKCGNIEKAMHVFENVNEKNIDHWNAMIGGLAIHGRGDLAFDLFMEMERLSIKPDDITFIAVLHACGHSGMMKEGLICFEIMRRVHKIVPKMQHYGCVVDILSRAGHIEEATNFVKEMPIKPNDVVWRTLLSGCANHENLNVGEPVAKRLIGMDFKDSSSYVLLSNMYAQFGHWEYVRKVRAMMKERDLSKVPGCSWIELEGTVHEFFVGSALEDHEAREIYSTVSGSSEL
ncbi:pentatricopeptide repeat-containing protein at2g45350 chloroplastic [Phtheirospermum japonicum]|uniref:Pentatricopeptide repeat-containing protein at2g45350 chloroplastic n=1 Tax=Phtheirospermum japonicum TaxID=374723 RepID=A0A830C7A7_9LAMI|nr:pentatricopeptide repeat-containing protein at2g45350 chloroplastic [Phtheirospermum japonicum]